MALIRQRWAAILRMSQEGPAVLEGEPAPGASDALRRPQLALTVSLPGDPEAGPRLAVIPAVLPVRPAWALTPAPRPSHPGFVFGAADQDGRAHESCNRMEGVGGSGSVAVCETASLLRFLVLTCCVGAAVVIRYLPATAANRHWR